MVQTLICTQDWLRTKGMSGVDIKENLQELEELEKGNDNFLIFLLDF